MVLDELEKKIKEFYPNYLTFSNLCLYLSKQFYKGVSGESAPSPVPLPRQQKTDTIIHRQGEKRITEYLKWNSNL